MKHMDHVISNKNNEHYLPTVIVISYRKNRKSGTGFVVQLAMDRPLISAKHRYLRYYFKLEINGKSLYLKKIILSIELGYYGRLSSVQYWSKISIIFSSVFFSLENRFRHFSYVGARNKIYVLYWNRLHLQWKQYAFSLQ